MRLLCIDFLLVTVLACQRPQEFSETEKQADTQEIEQMLGNFFSDIKPKA